MAARETARAGARICDRCLYPAYEEDLDPVLHPEAFTIGEEDPVGAGAYAALDEDLDEDGEDLDDDDEDEDDWLDEDDEDEEEDLDDEDDENILDFDDEEDEDEDEDDDWDDEDD
jgi:hypothetical protein